MLSSLNSLLNIYMQVYESSGNMSGVRRGRGKALANFNIMRRCAIPTSLLLYTNGSLRCSLRLRLDGGATSDNRAPAISMHDPCIAGGVVGQFSLPLAVAGEKKGLLHLGIPHEASLAAFRG